MGIQVKFFQQNQHLQKKEYALKELNVNNKNLEEIEKEDDNLKILDHPNIINFKSAFLSNSPNELLNIITEYIDIGDISKELHKHQKKKNYFKKINYQIG